MTTANNEKEQHKKNMQKLAEKLIKYLQKNDMFHMVNIYVNNQKISSDEPYEKEKNGTVVEIAKGTAENINLSLIATKLIKEVGTLCKQYASDFLITWNELINIINTTAGYAVADKYVIFFGIRKNGIDSNDFMVIRLTENPKYKYEAIYAVTVLRIPEDQEITCILKEINQE